MEKNKVKLCLLVITLLFGVSITAQSTRNQNCFISIKDFGAKMDGKNDDSQAIQRSLEELNYAYIPVSENGVRIDKTIVMTENQNLFGMSRASVINSYVPAGSYTIRAHSIRNTESAQIKDLAIDIKNKGANGIQAFETRNVYMDNIVIKGNRLCGVGIQLNGGKEHGSAWNQIRNYTITRCNIGIELTSDTKNNFCNRNNIEFGVVQSCNIAVRLYRSSTNIIKACPQGSPKGYVLEKSKYNIIEAIIENSKTNTMTIDDKSNYNTISGAFMIQSYSDKGRGNRLLVGSPKNQKANLD